VNCTRSLIGVLAAAALLAAGCGGTTGQVGSGATTLVPASAPAFVAIDADPSSQQWQTIDALASKFPDKQKAVDSIESDLRKQDVDWDRDVKPVLQGELDFAWLDLKRDGQNFVALLQPKDEAKFKQLVAKSSDKPAYDKFRGWYVIARKQQTIDRFERESNDSTSMLADDKTFVQSMDRLGHDSVVRAYVNGKSLMKVPALRPFVDKIGKLDWIALRMGATSEGIGLDTIVHGTPGALFKGGSTKLLDTVPADALVYLSFHGSKGMFNGLMQAPVLNVPQFRQFARPLQQIGRILEGENALYARPGKGMPEVTLVTTPPKGVDGAAIIDRLAPGLYHADVGGRFVVSTQKPASSSKSLGDNAEFQQAKAASGMPDKTSSTLYVNIHAGVPYVEKLAHQRIPAEIARNIAPLRSAVEYAASHTHELQVTFFLRIK
jgi:hypothetical protein